MRLKCAIQELQTMFEDLLDFVVSPTPKTEGSCGPPYEGASTLLSGSKAAAGEYENGQANTDQRKGSRFWC